ncbi:MAG TPA: glycoside hydrolase family 3 C-terminal domain-containing protein [Gemmatimonadales bacterium]|jgi:beta-glucosidase
MSPSHLRILAVAALVALASCRPAQPAPTGPASLPFRNSRLAVDVRARDLVHRLTLNEKVSQLVNSAAAIPRLEIPAYNWWNEALHGVARNGLATVFPQAIGLAATWDTVLQHQIAHTIGIEARAKYAIAQAAGQHRTYQGLTFWSPNINIFRDPRWGRGMETYGEDPWLTARMAVAFVHGLQGDDPHYLMAVATPKHFAVHSGPEPERHGFDAVISARDLNETYLPAFKAAITEGHAGSTMCAYNRIDGSPACASDLLLQQTLRGAWHFQGYVVTDCDAIYDIVHSHKTSPNTAAASAAALLAGTDLNCGDSFTHLGEAVAQGLIPERLIDTAAVRLFSARIRLGLFDPPAMVPYARIGADSNNTPGHAALALRAAESSLVLLKNNGTLPLDRNRMHTIAVIGPNADDHEILLGNYNGTPSSSVTPLEGITAAVAGRAQVRYARGSRLANGLADSSVDSVLTSDALAAARDADVIVLCLGLSPRLEGEELNLTIPGFRGGDRTSLDLPAPQEQLLKTMVATGKPVVVVLLSGSAVALNWANDSAAAILAAWYPGQAGGTAIAAALFGDANPGGRLPVTVYHSVDDLPAFTDYSMANRTYRHFTGDVLYPFGYGLSYTTFRYDAFKVPATVKVNQPLPVSVTVVNTGQRVGDEVVELYLTDQSANVPVPIRSLVGFTRVTLAPGEQRVVHFTVTSAERAALTDAGTPLLHPGGYLLSVGGGQPGQRGAAAAVSAATRQATFTVVGGLQR